MFRTEAHIGIGSKVVDQLSPDKCLLQAIQIEQINLKKIEIWICQCIFQKTLLTSRKIIDANHPVTVCQQAVAESTADETRNACNYNIRCHYETLLKTQEREMIYPVITVAPIESNTP